MTFQDIINWFIDNKDSLISSAVVTIIIGALSKLYSLKSKIPKVIKAIQKTKGFRFIEYLLLYILPLITIVFMTLVNTTDPTFKNIAVFIIICVTLIFNILMSHISTIYRMIGELTEISSKKLTKIDKTFEKVYNHIEKTKANNNLK